MVKHVFRLSTYGGLYHEGEYVKETEKTVTYTWASRSRETRVEKRSVLIIETDDPERVTEAYAIAWKSYEQQVAEARKVVKDLDLKRKAAAMSAARSAAEQ